MPCIYELNAEEKRAVDEIRARFSGDAVAADSLPPLPEELTETDPRRLAGRVAAMEVQLRELRAYVLKIHSLLSK